MFASKILIPVRFVVHVLDETFEPMNVATHLFPYQMIGISDMLLVKCLSYRGP
jgi:hypothetical protein